MEWRLIEVGTYSAKENMAIDNAIYDAVAENKQPPTIRFYRWKNNTLSIGAYHEPKKKILDACKKSGVSVVRRMTAGKTIFHHKWDLSYSMIAPIKIFKYSMKNAMDDINYSIMDGLAQLNIKSRIEGRNEIKVGANIVSSNVSKAMDKGVIVSQGNIMYDTDMQLLSKIFDAPLGLTDRLVTSIKKHRKVSQQRFYATMKQSFIFAKKVVGRKISNHETQKAKLYEIKYDSIEMPIRKLIPTRRTRIMQKKV